jgi:hypothetical protein
VKPSTLLAADISTSDTTLTVRTGDGALFPSPSGPSSTFYAQLNDGPDVEIVLVTARSGDTFTIARAQQGTIAHIFLARTPTTVSFWLIVYTTQVTSVPTGSFPHD